MLKKTPKPKNSFLCSPKDLWNRLAGTLATTYNGLITKTDPGPSNVKKAMTRKVNPPYAGPVTFLGIDPGPRAGARFSVVGVPWDGAVSNRPGQRFGPRNIRLASTMLTQEEHPLFLTAPSEVTQDLGDILLDQHSYSAHNLLKKNSKPCL